VDTGQHSQSNVQRASATNQHFSNTGTGAQFHIHDPQVLNTLVRHAGQVLALVWDDPTGLSPGRVKYGVLRLRRRLGFTDAASSPIEAVRGFGYRYVPPVKR
jgi:DNA-binding response OmpR family regulator